MSAKSRNRVKYRGLMLQTLEGRQLMDATGECFAPATPNEPVPSELVAPAEQDQLAVLEVAQRNELASLLVKFDQAWTPTLLSDYCDRLQSNRRELISR